MGLVSVPPPPIERDEVDAAQVRSGDIYERREEREMMGRGKIGKGAGEGSRGRGR